MLSPHDHRGVADLTISNPADVIFEIPLCQLRCFAEFTGRRGAGHFMFNTMVEPAATVLPTPGVVEITLPARGPVPSEEFKPTALSIAAAFA